MAAVLVVIDDPSMAQPIPLLRDAHRIASRLARVGNDLRSRERERGEPKSRVLTVAARQFSVPEHRADADGFTLLGTVSALAERDLEDLRCALRRIGSGSGVHEEIVMRAVMGLLSLYEVGDLHQLSALTVLDSE